jgi:glycosyltransferase involved in cell wall biosynthesis
VSLKKTELFKTVIPTKMLEFMSCARPVLLGVEGQARKILEEAQAGVCYEPGNATALAQAITALASDRGRCEILGQNGRRHSLAHFSREQTAQDYLSVLERVLGRAQRTISAAA